MTETNTTVRCATCWRVVEKHYVIKRGDRYTPICTECFGKQLLNQRKEGK